MNVPPYVGVFTLDGILSSLLLEVEKAVPKIKSVVGTVKVNNDESQVPVPLTGDTLNGVHVKAPPSLTDHSEVNFITKERSGDFIAPGSLNLIRRSATVPAAILLFVGHNNYKLSGFV